MVARHAALNSQDWRANAFDKKKPQDSFYFPGFNLGGPLTKGRDKLFFFAGVEWQRQNKDLGLQPSRVPTEGMRKGDFSDTAYLNSFGGGAYNVSGVPAGEGIVNGRIAPALIDKGGSVLLNVLPLPNQDPNKSFGYNYATNIINPEHRNQQLGRLDYNISDNTKLYTRLSHEHQAQPFPFTLWWTNPNSVPWPGDVYGNYHFWSSSTTLVHVLNPATTNEVVFAVTRRGMPHKLRQMEKVSRKALGYPYRGIFGNTTDILPNYTDWGGGLPSFIQPGGLDDPGFTGNKLVINVRDDFSKVVGTHTMKFGGFFEYNGTGQPAYDNDQGQLEPAVWGGNSTGNAFADLLMGRVAEYEEGTKTFVGDFAKREISGFAQDSWKATRRLTLELGSRFQHQGWLYEKHGWMYGFDPELYDPRSAIGAYTGLLSPHLGWKGPKSIWKTPALLIAPRIGFAWDLREFRDLLEPYLIHFGVPYEVRDVSQPRAFAELADAALIVIGHRGMDAPRRFVTPQDDAELTAAVNAGTGLVSFDGLLAARRGDTEKALYEFPQAIFGVRYARGVPAKEITISSAHYVTSLRPVPRVVTLKAAMLVPGFVPGPDVAVPARTGELPLLMAAQHGAGRAVLFASYDWVRPDIKGKLYGLDDLVWRSLVWAARKPFVRRLNWATYTVDVDGKNRYIRDMNWLTDGYGDYVRHFIRAIGGGARACARGPEPPAADLLGDAVHHLRRGSDHLHKIRYALVGAVQDGRLDTEVGPGRRN